jgi:hypothetical protein
LLAEFVPVDLDIMDELRQDLIWALRMDSLSGYQLINQYIEDHPEEFIRQRSTTGRLAVLERRS